MNGILGLYTILHCLCKPNRIPLCKHYGRGFNYVIIYYFSMGSMLHSTSILQIHYLLQIMKDIKQESTQSEKMFLKLKSLSAALDEFFPCFSHRIPIWYWANHVSQTLYKWLLYAPSLCLLHLLYFCTLVYHLWNGDNTTSLAQKVLWK